MTNPSRRATEARLRDLQTAPPSSTLHPFGSDSLMQGWPLAGEPDRDLSLWCDEVLNAPGPPLPVAVRSALVEAQDSPNGSTAVVLSHALDHAAASRNRHLMDMGRLSNLALRARISAAFLGDAHSCLLVALEASSRALSTAEDHVILRYAVTNQLCMTLAGIALAGSGPVTSQRLGELRDDALGEVLNLAEVISLFQPTQGHGTLRDDTEWVKDEDHEASPPLVQSPGLVVVETVEHLPGTARDGTKDGTKGGSAHSPRTEWAPFAGVRIPLRPVPNLVEVRERLLGKFPHLAGPIQQILTPLAGKPFVRIPPILLVGSPGAGKTLLARELAEALGVPSMIQSCSGVADSAISGTSRQWGTGRASAPAQLIKNSGVANPFYILDEIDKVATGKHNGSLVDAVLSMLDHAESFHDIYLECTTNLSGVNFLATANSLAAISAPLLDRFRVIQMPEPRAEDLPVLLRHLIADLRDEQETDDTWLPDLCPDEQALIAEAWPGGSVRRLRRILTTVLAGRENLAPRH